MRTVLIPILALCALSPAFADSERPDHFQGAEPTTLGEAFTLLREHNTQLAAIVEQDALSASDMTEIHRLSYTLENALERIEDEVEALAERLEEVHVASEEMDRDTVRRSAPEYLSGSDVFLQR